MRSGLLAALREERTRSLIAQAEIIRDFPAGPDRTEQAEYFVREASLLREIGRLTQEGESRIFSVLHFVMPGDAPPDDDRPPASTSDESPATDDELWEAYRCQIDRQSCPGCGEEPFVD